MPIVQTNKMQEESNVAEVTAADDAATAEMAAKAAADETANDQVSSEQDSEHPNTEAEQWGELTDEYEADEQLTEPVEKETPEVPEVTDVVTEEEVPAEAEVVPPAVADEVVKDTLPTDDVSIPEVPKEEDKRSADEVKLAMDKARTDARDTLVQSFQLTEEQVDEFREDPNSILPQMAADLYLDIFNSVMQSVQRNIPVMMQGVTQKQDAVKAHQQAFYNAWPQLADAKYVDTINRITASYQALNPNADAETAIKEIGAQAWVTLRLPIDQLSEHTQANNVPVVDTNVPPRAAPRTPANAGNVPSAAKAPVKQNLNVYEQFADEFLEEDL